MLVGFSSRGESMNKKALGTMIILAVLAVNLVSKEHKRDWQTGKLLKYDAQGWTSSGGSTTTGQVDDYGNIHTTTSSSTWRHVTYYVIVDGGDFLYYAERTLSFRWQRSPALAVENAPIEWAVEKRNLFIRPPGGKEFKMSLVKMKKK